MDFITHRNIDGDSIVVMTVIGEIDESSAPLLRVRLCEQPRCDVLDCRFVHFMSAAGIAALLDGHDRRPFTTVASRAVELVVGLCDLERELDLADPDGRPALDHFEVGVALVDRDLRFQYVNTALADINGMTLDAHLGRTPSELFRIRTDTFADEVRRALHRRIAAHAHVHARTASHDGMWNCDILPVAFRRHGEDFEGALVLVAPAHAVADDRHRLELDIAV